MKDDEEGGKVRGGEDGRRGELREGEVREEHGDGGERRHEGPRQVHHPQEQDGQADREGNINNEDY